MLVVFLSTMSGSKKQLTMGSNAMGHAHRFYRVLAVVPRLCFRTETDSMIGHRIGFAVTKLRDVSDPDDKVFKIYPGTGRPS